jgi:hypothetical protein
MLGQLLTALEALAANDDAISKPVPMEMNGLLGKVLGNSFHVERAWTEIPSASVRAVVANIRSKLLDFMLEIREQLGESTTDANMKDRAAQVDAAKLFHNAIFGANTTINIGDYGTQVIRSHVHKGDWTALSSQLETHGVPRDEIEDLRKALDADQKAQTDAMQGQTGKWLLNLMSKAAKGGLKIGMDVASTVVTKALTQYLGG